PAALNPGQAKWLLTHTARAVSGPGTGAGYPQIGAAVDFAGYVSSSNRGIKPNRYVLAAYLTSIGKTLSSVSWNNVSWANVSWDNVSWDNVSWDNVSWDNVSWDNVSWDNVTWQTTD